jgi:branched-chain amino acid aminotransferase
MTEPVAYLNNRTLPQSKAHLALNDAGFIFGATVTDLCRTIRHRLYRWPEHLARFRRSCALTGIRIDHADDEITRRAYELVEHNASLLNEQQDLALVLLATPGPIGFYIGQSTAPGDEPTFGMHTFPLPFAHYRPWITDGVHLRIPSVRQIPAACIDPHIKHRSRLHYWLARRSSSNGPHAQELLLDVDGNVTETASSNFLLVKNGAILSPPRESILEGVSLGVVSELTGRLGIPMQYRNISLEDCRSADEALLTCTTYCVAGVRTIDGRSIPWPGPTLCRLVEAWSAEVGIDIHGQIMSGAEP